MLFRTPLPTHGKNIFRFFGFTIHLQQAGCVLQGEEDAHRLTGEKLSARAGLEREMQTSCG